jgi:hypothetical protein
MQARLVMLGWSERSAHIGDKLIGRGTVRHMWNSGRRSADYHTFEGLGKPLRPGV